MDRMEVRSRSSGSGSHGIALFFVILLVLAGLRLLLPLVTVPVRMLVPLGMIVTAVFIAGPVLAVFFAARYDWAGRHGSSTGRRVPWMALAFLFGGLAAHVLAWILSTRVLEGMAAQGAIAFGQMGLIVWCTGLGALLATLLKDKNLLIPVSIFLVGFDIFLVMTPLGFTQQIMERTPQILPAVAMQIPTVGSVQPFAYVGPADILFLGMFFVALYKFDMRVRQTMLFIIPAILIYLALLFVYQALPLLVPIGLTVLLVNWPEFKLNKEEWASTALVVALVIGAIFMGRSLPAPQTPAGDEANVEWEQPAAGEAIGGSSR
jgi:hypothetical protein